MATPVAHSLAGLAVASAVGPTPDSPRGSTALLAAVVSVVSANAADLDFIPGLLVGDAVRFHHGLSHSLSFVALWAVLGWFFAKAMNLPALRLSGIAGLSYGTHILIDAATADGRAPHGIPLLAPFSDHHWIFPWTPFRGVLHGNPGDSATMILDNVISLQNAWTMVLELVFLIPVLGLCWWIRRLSTDEAGAHSRVQSPS